MEAQTKWGLVTVTQLAKIIKTNADRVLIIDSRSFLEYNTSHISHSVNVCCSKLVKRRLQQDKVLVRDLLAQTCEVDTVNDQDIIVYDQCSASTYGLSPDCFLLVLLKKLVKTFNSVYLLQGGFLEFQTNHTTLCESKTTTSTSSGGYKCPPLTSMSQPCLPVSNVGPIKILPFLYLGSQTDALSQDIMQQNGITYVLNVSTACPRPPFIAENHFLRLAVNDNYSDKLIPLFPDAFQFLDKVRESSENVLIHCLAGISRSATVAIAYIMYHLNMSSDEAYKYVKDKRPTISPNFNFLGQLLEYEKQLKQEKGEQENVSPPLAVSTTKKQCTEGIKSPGPPKIGKAPSKFSFKPFVFSSQAHTTMAVQSPTTALSKLSFTAPSPVNEECELTPVASKSSDMAFPQFPTTSLDLLSFTPCLASDGREASPARWGTSALVAEVRSPLTGTKRPLSSTLSLELGNTTNNTSQDKSGFPCPDGNGHCGPAPLSSQDVKLRSPEMKAKRPLVRPNSIAFSTYPSFDAFSSEKQQQKKVIESSQPQCSVMDFSNSITMSSTNPLSSHEAGQSNSNVHSISSHDNSSFVKESVSVSNTHQHQCRATYDLSLMTPEEQPSHAPPPRPQTMMVTSNSSYVVEMRTKEAGQGRTSAFEQARKSRSLEDILNMDGEENIVLGGCPSHVRSRRQKRLINAAELLSQGSAMDAVHRCRVPGDSHHHHQSSSSISSSGSHSSLHGSLEVIQVS